MSEPAMKMDVGTALPDYHAVVGAERQRRYHEAAEVPAGLFGDTVDISILANDCIHATSHLRTGKVDAVHFGQRMRQSAPVALDEPLTLRGHLAETSPMAKGAMLRYAFDFYRADGSVPVQGEIMSFRVNPDAMRANASGPGKPFNLTGFETVSYKHTTEARVTGYSFEFPDYLVHFEPEQAATLGLKAPLAQGLMSLTFMTEALARGGLPRELDITAEFRRPIFWDDHVDLLARGDSGFFVRKDDGTICSAGRVAHLLR